MTDRVNTDTAWPPPWTLKPTHGQPEVCTGDGDVANVGWDLSFGCRMSVGAEVNEPDVMKMQLHFSDADLARGFVSRQVTSEQLRRFAGLLGWLAEEHDRLAEFEAKRERQACPYCSVSLEAQCPTHRAYPVARCGQRSAHGPHVVDHGPDRPRNCPGTADARLAAAPAAELVGGSS